MRVLSREPTHRRALALMWLDGGVRWSVHDEHRQYDLGNTVLELLVLQPRPAEQDLTILAHVIDALKRVDHGTFGRCVVDGEQIYEETAECLWT